jgi:hypothetical protein
MEFLTAMGIALLFFTLFFLAINYDTQEKRIEKEGKIVNNLAMSIKKEIDIASSTQEGYIREFNVPNKILGNNYEIQIVGNHIYIKSDNKAMSLKIKEVIGEIQKGANIIKKTKEGVYLN